MDSIYLVFGLFAICLFLASWIFLSQKKTSEKKNLQESIASIPQNFEEIKKILIEERDSCLDREKMLSQTISELQENQKKQHLLFQENLSQEKARSEGFLSELQIYKDKFQLVSQEKSKVLSQKKSSEVRLGHIAETLAPFLDEFDFNPEECVFMGKPIDYISFGEEEVTFIEVKSGNSKLNSKQRHIRDLIKSNSVCWKEVRLK